MKRTKKFLSLLLAAALLVSLLPATALATSHEGQVHVVVENTTYTVAQGAAWEGTLVSTWVDISNDSTMMSAVLAALNTVGASQTGAESNYISSVNGLDAGSPDYMSGWMGTLNDWFVNAGFNDFAVADGGLESGDEIRIMFSTNGGEDLGGSWNNNDKAVKAISFSKGELTPDFDKDTHSYTLTVPAGTTGIVVTPTAANKNFQVRTSVNGTEYKRTAAVPVEDGTVITVKCGDSSWPSMNGGDYGTADSIPAETYTITVSMETSPNTAPALKEDISATAAASVDVGQAYTLDLSSIFTDADSDALTYKVSVDGAAAVTAAESYSDTPTAAGSHTLVFTANDGKTNSTETYTVTLTVNQPSTFKVDGQTVTFENMGFYYKATVPVQGQFTVSVLANPDVNIAGSLTGTGSATAEFTPTASKTTVCVILQQGMSAGVRYYIYAEQSPGETPDITTDLSTDAVEYTVGADASAFSVSVADLTDGGVLSYQWYSSSDNTTFAPIDGATAATYTPSTEAAGTTYYKVIVTNTLNFTTAAAESRVAEVSVKQQEYAKLAALMIHTGYSPADSTVLMKNESDSYSTSLVFDPDTLSYTLAPQPDSVTQLRFQALAADDGATVTVNYLDGGTKDITWTSGSSKWANCLAAGRNVFTIVVTPADGSDKLPTTYTFTIDCVPTLSGLSIGNGSTQYYLDKTFAATTTDYTATVPSSATKLDITAVPSNSAYSVAYNGDPSGTVNISLIDKIDIVVTGGEGENALSRTYTVNLAKAVQLDFSVNAAPSDAIVKVYDQTGADVSANSDGSFSGLFSTYNYTYTVTKYGYAAQSGTVPATGGTLSVTLPEAADDGLADVGAYWKNFRGSETNMAITDVELPIDTENINLKWNAKLGSGWSAAPSVQIIVDNALVVMSGTTIYKLDLKTGATLATGSMAAAPNFGYTPPTYAEGMIFAPLTGGRIQAFNAKTLESLWVYTDNLGGQSLSPIAYDDGYIYTGFWNSETRNANFVCLSVTDENVTKTDEAKTATWKHTQPGGFYWAGAVVVGDAVIVGTDDGASGYTGTAKLYSFNQYTGAVISSMDISGDQRSSIAYDQANSKVYFTTKNGYLYSAKVNAKTGSLSGLKGVSFGAQSTSTPVVYDGKVYFGTGSGISSTGSSGNLVVADANSLEMLYAVGLKGYPQCSMLLTTAYEDETGSIYLYSTYNSTPGGISMIKVDPDATTAAGAQLIELYDAAGFSQYCISSLICGADGTLYYKNDSGNVLAVGIPEAVGVIKLINAIGPVTLNSGNAITIARNAYGALPDDQKANVTNYAVLTAAESTFSALQVSHAEGLINAIGTVTLSSGDAISAARNAYDALTTAQKAKVDNYVKLNAAETRYAQLAADTAAAKAVDNLIDSIGTVTLESKGTIAAARSAYDVLTNAQRALVTKLSLLTAAETKYAELESAAKQDGIDRAAAAGVEKLISAIGTVTMISEDDINAARAAYNALTTTQKALVANYATLTTAETAYALLKAEDDQTKADRVIKLIKAIGEEITLDSEEDITAARTAYNKLTSAQKELVSNYSVLKAAEKALTLLQEATEGTEKVTVSLKNEDTPKAANADGKETVTIGGQTYTVDAQIAAAMKKIEGIAVANGEPDINSVISAYLAYQQLTDDQKVFVANHDALEIQMQAIAKRLHADASTGITVDGLDWYVQVTGTIEPLDSDEAATLQQQIGGDKLLLMANISLHDLIADKDWEPGTPVTVRIPAPDMAGFDGAVIVHQKDDGSIEYIEAAVEDGMLVFTASSFSNYGVAGYKGRSPLELGDTTDMGWLIWAGIGVVLLAALVALLAVYRKRMKANG